MAHMIDQSTGKAAIAFINEEPWHGLGQRLTPGADIDTWIREAGLGYRVERTPVLFADNKIGVTREFAGKQVLLRGDTREPLSVVGDDYRVVQPAVVMDFFAELVKHNGFQMEVAGVLDQGRRVWGLAKVNDGAPVIGQDVVRPYVLLATSYDGTMATTAKFTSVRVVCHNTLSMSAGYAAGRLSSRQGETDRESGAVVQCVRVPHTQDFDPAKARTDLGIVLSAFDRFLVESRMLAETKVDEKFVVAFLKSLLPQPKAEEGKPAPDVEAGRTFRRLLAIWKGEVPSATLPEAQGTAWGVLNAVTWHVDHLRGAEKHRLSSAWFGTGEALKNKARDLLVETVS